jgi:hypothetical protein
MAWYDYLLVVLIAAVGVFGFSLFVGNYPAILAAATGSRAPLEATEGNPDRPAAARPPPPPVPDPPQRPQDARTPSGPRVAPATAPRTAPSPARSPVPAPERAVVVRVPDVPRTAAAAKTAGGRTSKRAPAASTAKRGGTTAPAASKSRASTAPSTSKPPPDRSRGAGRPPTPASRDRASPAAACRDGARAESASFPAPSPLLAKGRSTPTPAQRPGRTP